MNTVDEKPKHKPSERHTLEEVLKSLQDLIRNDLLENAPPAKPPPAAASGTPPAHAEPSGPVDIHSVMQSLRELVGKELTAEDAPAPSPAPAAASVAETPLPEGKAARKIEPATGTLRAKKAPAQEPPPTPPPKATGGGGLQQHLPFDAARSTDDLELTAPPGADLEVLDTGSTKKKPSAPGATRESRTLDAATQPAGPPAPEVVRAADASAPGKDLAAALKELDTVEFTPSSADDAAQAPAFDLDDIPVLDDIVLESPGATSEIPVLFDEVAVPAPKSPPSPERARDLAIQVIARLNIELRKSGATALDPQVIPRLQALLREALEREAANRDNNAPKTQNP